MKRLARTVPANYIRLDDTVTSADRFINQRDMQIARANHNKLIGYTGARCAYHCQLGASGTAYASFVNPEFCGISDAIATPPIIRSRVLLTPNIRKVKVWADAQGTKVANTALYFVLSHPGVERQVSSAESQVWSAPLGGVFGTEVTVPPGGIPRLQWREFDFAVYVNPTSIGAAISSNVTITAASTFSVTVATASLVGTEQRGDLMHFDTAAGVQPYPNPRIITSVSTSGAGANTIFHVLWPWGAANQPVAGTNRVTIRQASAIELTRLAIVEVPTDDFDAYRGLYS